MPGHFHAVLWIDPKQARVFRFNVDEADRKVIRPGHSVREVHHGAKRNGHRVAEDRAFFEAVANAVAGAGAILVVGPANEKDEFAKFLADKHPAIRTRIEGVERSDHPTDGELLDHARRYVKAADRLRP